LFDLPASFFIVDSKLGTPNEEDEAVTSGAPLMARL